MFPQQDYRYVPEFEYSSSMHWGVLFICIVIGIIIVFQIANIFLNRKQENNTRYRYLVLAIIFLSYNLFNGLLPDVSFPGPLILQYVITYGISILMCVYLVWYLYKEFNIISPSPFFKIKSLGALLFSSFLLLFLIPYYFTSSLNYARSLFLILPTILAVIFMRYFFLTIKTKQELYFKTQTYLGLGSILSIILLPLLTYFGDFQPITQPLVSLAFFIVTIMEVNSYLYKLKNAHVFNVGNKDKYNFINRENEIALQIISGHSYKEIAENMFVSYGTIRKHASNIFIKSDVTNKKDFTDKFKVL